jgi:hypothetical protein
LHLFVQSVECFLLVVRKLFVLAGHKQALDVAAVVQGQVTYHSILMLSWGTTFATSYIENSKCKYYLTLVL